MTNLRKVRYGAFALILSGAYAALTPGNAQGTAVSCEWLPQCGNPGCSGPPPDLAAKCGICNRAIGCNPTVPCYEDGYAPGNWYWCEDET
jgi:hypothetical protein